VARTVEWYRKAGSLKNAKEFQKLTRGQISQYVEQARAARLSWVQP
jgi:hypothetical protein